MTQNQPTLFVPHGAPTFALRPGAAGAALVRQAQFLPLPRAIVIVSAHWDTDMPTVGFADRLETIHDFSGFPDELYSLRYPASGCREAAELVEEGQFSALKLRLGRAQARQDRDAINRIRKEVGDDIKLMVDFNQGRTFGDAIERCQALDDAGLYWFEEPIVYDNFDGYAALRAKLKTPIQLGENFYGPRDMYHALQAGAGDYVMPDLMRIGGVSGWLRSAPIAAAAGIQVSTHLYPEVSAHLMRVTETAHWLEWQDWANPILREPFTLADGHLLIPDRPGAGIAWDEAAVKHYRIEM